VRHRVALGVAILLTATCIGGRQADAGFRVCNQDNQRISVAMGYVDHVRGWMAEGWWVIGPGECTSIHEADLDNRYYYLYAKSTDGGKSTWSGDVPFCIQDRKFLLLQAQYGKNTRDDCAKAGLDFAQFVTVEVGHDTNHTHNFAGAGGAPVAPPAVAGGGGAQPRPYQSPVAVAPAPQPAPPAAPGGGGAACQRYPNLC
jgi:uncharacterized membrane protein